VILEGLIEKSTIPDLALLSDKTSDRVVDWPTCVLPICAVRCRRAGAGLAGFRLTDAKRFTRVLHAFDNCGEARFRVLAEAEPKSRL
jgi:hypothetical protein